MFHRFLVFFKASRKFAFGFPDITLVTIFAWDRVDGATSLIFRYWVFRFRKQIPDGLVWFLSNNFAPDAAKGFCILPDIKGTSEPIKQILSNHDIIVGQFTLSTPLIKPNFCMRDCGRGGSSL